MGQVQLFAVGSSRSQGAVSQLAGFLNERGIGTSLSFVGMLVPPLSNAVEFRGDGVYVNADI